MSFVNPFKRRSIEADIQVNIPRPANSSVHDAEVTWNMYKIERKARIYSDTRLKIARNFIQKLHEDGELDKKTTRRILRRLR